MLQQSTSKTERYHSEHPPPCCWIVGLEAVCAWYLVVCATHNYLAGVVVLVFVLTCYILVFERYPAYLLLPTQQLD